MFVPVSCTSCGKPFQVPETALGKLAPCPWCQAIVTALPVSAPATTAPAPAPQEPLSLDDAEPVSAANTKEPPTELKPQGVPGGTRGKRPLPEPRKPREARGAKPPTKRLLMSIFLVLVLMVVGTAGTLLVLGYGTGRMSSSGWIEFTPQDGSFTVALPDVPAETPIDANPAGSVLGGKRYSVRGWYSKTNVWVAYNDLDPTLARDLPADRDRVLAEAALEAERDREKVRLEGTVTIAATFRLDDWLGLELHMDTPRGKVIEWLLLAGKTAHPRLYVIGAEAKNLTPLSPVCTRLHASFRLND